MSLTSNTEEAAPATGARKFVMAPTATADNAIASGTVYIASISFDNSNNAAAASFLKLYDASAPTVGTTAPDWIISAKGGDKVHMVFFKNKPKFTTALSVACVTAAGTAGATSPTSAVSCTIRTQTAEDAV